MGAAAVMMAAGEKLPSNVKAAVEDCGYTSAWSVLSYQMKSQFHLPAFPFLYCADFVTRIRAGYGMKEADALKCVAGTRLPMFFIHGTEDRFVPFEMMKELYDVCRSEKECLAVDRRGPCAGSAGGRGRVLGTGCFGLWTGIWKDSRQRYRFLEIDTNKWEVILDTLSR